jgi:hypothetical protein
MTTTLENAGRASSASLERRAPRTEEKPFLGRPAPTFGPGDTGNVTSVADPLLAEVDAIAAAIAQAAATSGLKLQIGQATAIGQARHAQGDR